MAEKCESPPLDEPEQSSEANPQKTVGQSRFSETAWLKLKSVEACVARRDAQSLNLIRRAGGQLLSILAQDTWAGSVLAAEQVCEVLWDHRVSDELGHGNLHNQLMRRLINVSVTATASTEVRVGAIRLLSTADLGTHVTSDWWMSILQSVGHDSEVGRALLRSVNPDDLPRPRLTGPSRHDVLATHIIGQRDIRKETHGRLRNLTRYDDPRWRVRHAVCEVAHVGCVGAQ